MAIYHLSVKTISRSDGRSGTAASAYRAGVSITDLRTGQVHDYTRRRGVESSDIVMPANAPQWDRSQLWNAAELSENRKNSTVAREYELALPEELSPKERRELVREFANELVERHGVAVDFAIHLPGKEGDNRNHHAHVLTSTRRLGSDGFGEKSRELDAKETGSKEVEHWRERWSVLTNAALERAGQGVRVDHRSLKAQREDALALGQIERAEDLDRIPTQHLGPTPTLDLRIATKQKTEPLTERAREHLVIVAENRDRKSLLEQMRAIVRAGMDSFSDRYQMMKAGMDAFAERFNKWSEQQQVLALAKERALEAQRSYQPPKNSPGMSR